jgi:hypothetical protein
MSARSAIEARFDFVPFCPQFNCGQTHSSTQREEIMLL